jgi:hypothetical protein
MVRARLASRLQISVRGFGACEPRSLSARICTHRRTTDLGLRCGKPHKARSEVVRRQGLEPRTRRLRVCCSAN